MKLPNDLIKATDYSKAKDREIHEFEYRNGKYIHKYVLGGEHELTPQEVIDCLNAISTIDCDLQTAYAFIQGQKDKIADLEAKLAESEKRIQAYEEIVEQKDKEISFANRDKTCIVKQLNDPKAYVLLEDYKELKQQLAELDSELAENVRENECLKEQLAEKDAELIGRKKLCDLRYKQLQNSLQDKISFAVEKLEKVKEHFINIKTSTLGVIRRSEMVMYIDNQIEGLKKGVE